MTKYVIINTHGDTIIGLSLCDAADMILRNDDKDYSIIKNEDGLGYYLWVRHEKANIPWTKTAIYTCEDSEAEAEIDIFTKVLWRIQKWGGFGVYTMDQYVSIVGEALRAKYEYLK